MVALSNSFLIRATSSMGCPQCCCSSTKCQRGVYVPVPSANKWPYWTPQQDPQAGDRGLHWSMPQNLDQILPFVTHAYNTSIYASTRSTLFEHSMDATLGSHQNRPLTSISNLPTWIVPLGVISPTNAPPHSTSKIPKPTSHATTPEAALRRESNYPDLWWWNQSHDLLAPTQFQWPIHLRTCWTHQALCYPKLIFLHSSFPHVVKLLVSLMGSYGVPWVQVHAFMLCVHVFLCAPF